MFLRPLLQPRLPLTALLLRPPTAPRFLGTMTHTAPPTDPNDLKLREISRDFRTDTITVPTDAMFDLMKTASRGDDVYGEDEATNALQERVAKMAGMEAGLFCVSGTMTNQLAIRTHLHQPPHSVLLDARSHIHLYEAGGVAFHSQASSLAIPPSNGHHLTLHDVESHLVRGDDIHSAPTRIVALENTLSGTINPQSEIIKISDRMRAEGVIMHCDGARMWEVLAATGMELEEACRPFDTVSLCLSKGLGAPIGSVLVGPKKFIEKAKWFRKCFGGGIRQCGSLAVAANYALDHNLPLLKHTHLLASKLAHALVELGVRLLLPTETHMCWIDPTPLGFTIDQLVTHAKTKGIRLGGTRIVVHFQITEQSIEDLVQVVRELKETHKGAEVLGEEVDQEENERFAKGDWSEMHGTRKTKRLGPSVKLYGKK